MWLAKYSSRMGVICAGAFLMLQPLGGTGEAGGCGPRILKAEAAVSAARHCKGPRLLSPGLHKHRPRYSGKLTTVRQLPAWMRPRLDAKGGLTHSVPAGHRPTPDLVDALLKAPDAESASIIRSLGLPLIEGVPPVVLLEQGPEQETPQEK